MKKILLLTLIVLFSFVCYGQKLKNGSVITLSNSEWDCGGVDLKKALIVNIKGRLYVKFDFEYSGEGKPQLMTVNNAYDYWRKDNTKIVKIKL